MLNYINELDIRMQYLIKSFYFSFPISLVFLFIMRDQRFLFSKNHFPATKNFFFCAFIIYAIMLLLLAVLISFTTFRGASHPIGNEGITNMLHKTPGIAIQLIGENIMFVSILFFGIDHTLIHNKPHSFNYSLFNIIWKLIWITPSLYV